MRTESDQQDGREEGWRAVRTLLNRALKGHGCGVSWRPPHIGRRKSRDGNGKRRRGDAEHRAMHARLLPLLRLAAAGVSGHLAVAMMLRRGTARPASGWRGLPTVAGARRGNASDDEPRREHNRDSLTHVRILTRAALRCQTGSERG